MITYEDIRQIRYIREENEIWKVKSQQYLSYYHNKGNDLYGSLFYIKNFILFNFHYTPASSELKVLVVCLSVDG